jgi:hypothetical protein
MWATATLCNVCYSPGYICLGGCALRNALETRFQLKRHNKNKHNHIDTFDDTIDSDWNDPTEQVIPLVVPPTVLCSKALQIFLNKSISDGMLVAIRHFVGGACYSTSMLGRNVMETVPLHDTYIVLLTARLVFRIGTVHQVLLSSLLSVFVYARPQTGPSSLPITRSQMRVPPSLRRCQLPGHVNLGRGMPTYRWLR